MSGVLVVRPSSLGDVVHALPIVADIARHAPDLPVDWVAEEAFAPLLSLHPGIRRVIPVALRRWRHHVAEGDTWREFAQFRRELRGERYDAVLDLQEQLKGAVMARLAHGTRHGFARQTIREPASTVLHDRHHAVARELHFEQRCRALAGKALGYEPEGGPRYGLVPPPPAPGQVPGGRFAVGVHVTSRPDKRWPEAHWHALIDMLGAAGLEVLLPWGNAEEHARSKALAQGHANAIVPTHQPLNLLAATLRAAEIAIGVDTGLVHLAAALGTPTVSLFTETDPARAGVAIAGPHARDLGGNGSVPTPDAVREAAATLLRAGPRC